MAKPRTLTKETKMNNNYAPMATETREMLALRGIEVDARVTGVMVITTLIQKCQNDIRDLRAAAPIG